MAAQPTYTLRLDVSAARRSLKRVIALAAEANRELARLEDQVGDPALRAKLAEYGIRLEANV